MMKLASSRKSTLTLQGVRDCAQGGPRRRNLPARPTHQRCAPKSAGANVRLGFPRRKPLLEKLITAGVPKPERDSPTRQNSNRVFCLPASALIFGGLK